MQVFVHQPVELSLDVQPNASEVLGTSLVLDLHEFPELHWLSTYLATLVALQDEHDRLTQAIQAITQQGEVYRNQWIEPYIKTKNGKQYTYHQLRWLTGERKQSGQPKVETKHLSRHRVAQTQAAIERGHQVAALEQQQKLVDAQINRLKQQIQRMGDRLKQTISTNSVALTQSTIR